MVVNELENKDARVQNANGWSDINFALFLKKDDGTKLNDAEDQPSP